MQNVSQKWKDNQEQYLVGESYVEVILNVGDPESQEDASVSDNGSDFKQNYFGTFRKSGNRKID